MLRRKDAKLIELFNRTRMMNRREALKRLDNIWRHGTTSINELRIVIDRIRDS